MRIPGGGANGASAAAVRYLPLHAMLVTTRPKQWIKNVLVVAAAGAAGALGHDDVPGQVTAAFLAFCLMASGIYAINDVRDMEEDRLHPRKRLRPIAAGQLDPSAASALGASLILAGLTLCYLVRPLLGAVGLAYVVLTLSYALLWRHVPLFDVGAIAGGFVLRAVAGGVAAHVVLSEWFVLVVSSAAVFVAAGKRQAELQRTQRRGTRGRRVLDLYTEPWLRLIVVGSAAGALFAYCVWAFQVPTVHGMPWRPLTVVPFALCLVRYGRLVRAGGGEAPEELMLSDGWLLLSGVAWLILFAAGVHAGS